MKGRPGTGKREFNFKILVSQCGYLKRKCYFRNVSIVISSLILADLKNVSLSLCLSVSLSLCLSVSLCFEQRREQDITNLAPPRFTPLHAPGLGFMFSELTTLD